MASPVLGIDLGTTNSVVAHADQQRVRVLRDRQGRLLTPSTVSFAANGDIAVGHAARDLRTVDAAHTVFSIKRLIGRPFVSPEVQRASERLPFELQAGPTGAAVVRMRSETYSLPEISAFILKHLRAIAEDSLGEPCTNAVITVPANFNELQRMATRDAGRIAGLNVLRILNEPTAAALAYGYRAQQSQRIAVYDFGGGTFDISILELSGDVIEVVATAGDTQLGGDDLDRAIVDRMLEQLSDAQRAAVLQQSSAYERLTLAAEWMKCQLSERDVAEATIKRLALSESEKIDLKVELSRSELGELSSPLISRTFGICEEALRLAGVRPTQLDAVLLVGGQTRTPRVREMVRDYFAMEPKFSVDPDLAVAHGAALQGYALAGVPAADPDKRVRTLAGAAATPLPTGPGSEPAERGFDDEPTTVGAPADARAVARATERSKGSAGRGRIHTPFRPLRVPPAAGQMPSLRPERPGDMFATTLSGMGEPSSDRPLAADPITVTSDVMPAFTAPTPSPPQPAGIRNTRDLNKPNTRAVLTPLRDERRVPEEPEYIASRPRMNTAPLPPLSPLPPADSDSDLPPVLRTSERPSRRDSDAVLLGPLEPLYEADDDDNADPTATLLDSPRAKARAKARSQPAPGHPSETHDGKLAHARALGAQGQIEAALLLYRELLNEQPHDPQLLDETRVLRTKLLLPSQAPQRRVSAKPPPPPPPRGQRAPQPARPADDSRVRAQTRDLGLPSALQPQLNTPIPAQEEPENFSQFPAPPSIAPLLLDVTPHTLCVETVSGFCEAIIERNAPIPTEQTRIFTTSRDDQTTVSVRVSQGESRSTDENQVLGHIELLALRPGRRGEVNIAVTFAIDVDGTLNVRAVDQATGRGQELRLTLTGAIDAQELERMRAKQQVLAS